MSTTPLGVESVHVTPATLANVLIDLAQNEPPDTLAGMVARLHTLDVASDVVESNRDGYSWLVATGEWASSTISVGGGLTAPVSSVDLLVWNGVGLDDAEMRYRDLVTQLRDVLGSSTILNHSGRSESHFWRVPSGDLEVFLHAEDEPEQRGHPNVQAHLARH